MPPGLCEPKGPPLAAPQRGARQALELRDRMAERGLGEEQLAGRRGERALPFHRPHDRQVAALQHSMSSIHGLLNLYHFHSSYAAATIAAMQALRNQHPLPPASAHPRLPARYDHVGSFLRPDYLLAARARKARGEINAAQLREVEDRAIAEIVRFQESVGMKAITDGEYRRTYFHIDFLNQLGGVKTSDPVIVEKADGSRELAPPVMRVVG